MYRTAVQGIFLAAILATGAMASSAALAAEAADGSLAVKARVKESCGIDASIVVLGDGSGFATGSVFESCNTQEGFQIVAQHRWLSQHERVLVNYAGQASYLQRDGWSRVATRLGAKFGTRPVSVRYSGLTQPLSLGLTITAL